MQEENLDSKYGPSYYVSRETPRLLESPDGWKLVGYQDRELGKLRGVRHSPFILKVSAGDVTGEVYQIDKLYFGHIYSILYIEGALLQNLIGPNYVMAKASKCAPYDPRPHLRDVCLGRISSAPAGTRLEEVVFGLGQGFS